MNELSITKVEKSSFEVIEAINSLLSQLVTSRHIYFSEYELNKIISSESSDIFLLYNEKNIVGMFTLGNYITPTGRKYWLEDVVVDKEFRGKYLGRKLVHEAIKLVSSNGKSTLMLTSKPSRVAANRLYISSGFQLKETNVYKMDFE